MNPRPLPQAWWPTAVMIILGLVGSCAVLGGITLLVTGARDRPPAHSPPPPSTAPTIAVVPEGER